MAQKATPKKSSVAEDPRIAQAMQNYEAGLRALQEHKFEKAKPLFEKVLAGPSATLRTAPPSTSAFATSTSLGRLRSSLKAWKSIMTTPSLL
jgi:hypothetical protein